MAGDVAIDGPTIRLKHVLAERDDRLGEADAQLLGLSKDLGVVPRSSMGDSVALADSLSKYKRVTRGQLVMNKMQAWNGAFAISTYDGVVSPDYTVLRFDGRQCDPRFIEYVVQGPKFAGQCACVARGMGTGFLRVNTSDLLSLRVPLPSLAAQGAIADYLDGETARIDALIVAKRRVGDLLEEQRQAWLSGMIRQIHASHTPLKHVAQIQGGVTLGKAYTTGDLRAWPYLRVANVQANSLDLHEIATIELPFAVAARHRLRAGDLLLAEGNGNPDNLGRAVVWEGDIPDCLHQNHVFALRPSSALRPKYLEAVLATDAARRHLREGASQVGIASISQERVLSLRVPVPPLGVQDQCTSAIGHYDARAGAIRRHLGTQIALLQERRQALITAAVAGQLDMPEAA